MLHDQAMRQAVVLAALGANAAAPNPRVGAVILDARGEVAGKGFHHRAGEAHAEILALEQAGERARSGTAVVTLEPCDHRGRTGPCTEALLAAGVSRLVYAVPDPTPAGGGAARLARAGVEVTAGVEEDRAREVNHEWLFAMAASRPHVTYKAAMTLDGHIAAVDGTSRWISGARSRLDVHRWRRRADVIVAGRATVAADGARLTARDADDTLLAHQPLRVVVDSHASTGPDEPVRDSSAPTLIAGISQFGDDGRGRVNLPELLADLFRNGHRGVLLEGGPTLAASFFAEDLVDRIVLYIAPLLLGSGRSPVGDLGIATLTGAQAWRLDDVARIGPDVRLVYSRPGHPGLMPRLAERPWGTAEHPSEAEHAPKEPS